MYMYIYIHDNHTTLIFHFIKLGNNTSKTWVLRFAYAIFWCYLLKYTIAKYIFKFYKFYKFL